MKQKDRTEELRVWLKTHPAIRIKVIEEEAGLPSTTLAKVVSPTLQKKLPHHHWEPLEVVLRKYGWK